MNMLNLSLFILLIGAAYAKGKPDNVGNGNGNGNGKSKVKPDDAGPLASCARQAGCLEFEIWDEGTVDSNGDAQYSLCVWWDETNELCYKDDTISHACPIQGDNLDANKVEGWASGQDNQLPCVTVPCGQSATFGVKDGQACDDGSIFDPPSNEFDITCSSGGSCGGNAKACQWEVTAPDCDDSSTTSTTTTTTPTPGSTTSTTTTTTTTTDAPVCVCENLSQSSTQCEACGGCQWATIGDDIEEGDCLDGTVSANMYTRSMDVLSVDDLNTVTGENKQGGMGYVMVSIEALIVTCAVLAVILLISVVVCTIRRRGKGNAHFVYEDDPETAHAS
eukprot:317691_1